MQAPAILAFVICAAIWTGVETAHAAQPSGPLKSYTPYTPYAASHASPPEYSAIPASDELISRAIARLDDVAQNILARSGVPGMAIAVVKDGEIMFDSGFGFRQIDTQQAVDSTTVFQLASLSKPIGATVVATQVNQKKVAWNTPVQALLPEFALSDPWVSQHVTIADFYAHRSGLPDHAGDDLEDLGYDRDAILQKLRFVRLKPFRSHYAYTNFGITAAAQAVAKAAGKDWATLSQHALYEPLGMQATSSRHSDYMARSNRATGHRPTEDGSGFQVSDLRQPDAQSPAGGVSSNVRDVARWMIMVLQNGRFEDKVIVGEDALLAAITPKMITGQSDSATARAGSYGYGFNVSVQPSGRVMLSHSGAFYLGAGSTFSMIPSLGLGIVVLTNASPVGAAEAVSATFMDMAQFGHSTRDWFAAYQSVMTPMTAPTGELAGAVRPASPISSRSRQTYTGTYQNAYFGVLEIVPGGSGSRNESLALSIGPAPNDKRASEPLSHWNADTFIYRPFGENAPAGSVSAVQFEEISEGKAQRVTIEHLNENGLGTFVRVQ